VQDTPHSGKIYLNPSTNTREGRPDAGITDQILTIAELLRGADVQMPPAYGTFQEAQQVHQAGGDQLALDVE
jgi:hypothetical protein